MSTLFRPALIALIALSLLLSACRSDRATDPSGSDDIPTVSGLSASLDTATGVVTLAWQGADYPGLDRYVVYRRFLSESAPPLAEAIGSTRSLFYVDSVWKAYPESTLTVTYRVSIMDTLERMGESSAPVSLSVPPPIPSRHPLALPPLGDAGWRPLSLHAIGERYLAIARKGDTLQSWTYDPAAKRWSGGSSWKPWDFLGSVKVVSFGGAFYIFATDQGALLKYEPEADRFTEMSELEGVNLGLGADLLASGDELIAVPLDYHYYPTNIVKAWNPATDTWREFGPKDRDHYYIGWQGRVFILENRNKLFEFLHGSNTWKEHTESPGIPNGFTYVEGGDGLYFMGQDDSGQVVFRFAPATGEWTRWQADSNPWRSPAGTVVHSEWFFAGGSGIHVVLELEGGIAIWTFAPAGGQWEEVTKIEAWMRPGGATYIDGALYIYNRPQYPEELEILEYRLPRP